MNSTSVTKEDKINEAAAMQTDGKLLKTLLMERRKRP
jgi:hypothetical protein